MENQSDYQRIALTSMYLEGYYSSSTLNPVIWYVCILSLLFDSAKMYFVAWNSHFPTYNHMSCSLNSHSHPHNPQGMDTENDYEYE